MLKRDRTKDGSKPSLHLLQPNAVLANNNNSPSKNLSLLTDASEHNPDADRPQALSTQSSLNPNFYIYILHLLCLGRGK